MSSGVPEVSEFGSVDPAPPAQGGDHRAVLLDEQARMFQRMRAVFALRNDGSSDAVDALCVAFASKSALLRHELAYVLGQLQNPRALPTLWQRLEDESEHVMVRHEAAEAMGATCDLACQPPSVRLWYSRRALGYSYARSRLLLEPQQHTVVLPRARRRRLDGFTLMAFLWLL